LSRTLIFIGGPTASGKTAAAVQLALALKAPVLSADARQVFKEMRIGTARPEAQELHSVPHYLLGDRSIHEPYDAARFEEEALALLEKLFPHHSEVIVVGGSGLYMKALANGLDQMPEVDHEIRIQIQSELNQLGLTPLVKELKLKDPVFAQQADLNNPRRVQRAIEVIRSTGKPYSEFRRGKTVRRDFDMVWIGLDPPRPLLYDRIHQRVDRMIREGLMEEVISLYPFRHLQALHTVGYTELFEVIDGKTSMDEAINGIKQNTRRYAKRQLTWFRRQHELHWQSEFDLADCLRLIKA
jgi:tRNA dimethylallyltransferase